MSGGESVNLLGYCFGSVLAMLYATRHPDAPLRSLTVLTTPVDLPHLGLLGNLVCRGGLDVDDLLDDDGNVPPQVVFRGFQSLKSTSTIARYVDRWERLSRDDYVASHQALIGWATDHVPLPGGVARQRAQMIDDNALVNDRLVLGGDRVHLADISVPFLTVMANRDHMVPEHPLPPCRPGGLARRARTAPGRRARGLLVGRTAATTTLPLIIAFLLRRSGTTAK